MNKAITSAQYAALVSELRDVLGPDAVADGMPERLAAHAVFPPELLRIKRGEFSHLPALVVRPSSAEEVAAVIRIAARFGVPVVPYGGGSGIVGGTWGPPEAVVLDLKGLTGIEVDHRSMTVAAGAGVNGMHLEETLNRMGLTSGHYPQSIRSATVGGMVSTSAVGTFSTGYGKMDDLVVGLEVVLPDGSIVRTPVQPKHSAGPNLNALFVGAEGVFGVVTRAWLKIFPLPEERVIEGYLFPNTEAGLEAVRLIVQGGIRPALIRLYDEHEAAPRLEALGMAPGRPLLLIGFDGPRRLVSVQRELAREVCQRQGGVYLGIRPGKQWLENRFSTAVLLKPLHVRGGIADALEVSAQWADLPRVWRAIRAAAEPLCETVHAHFSHFYQTGGSVYLIFQAYAADDEAAEHLYAEILDRVLSASLANGGNTSHHHGVGRAKVQWLRTELGPTYRLLERLKATLDPQGLLNPGVLGLTGGGGDAS